MSTNLVIDLRNVRLKDVDRVGGKNASLGELMNSLEGFGVRVPGGFATTAEAYRHYLDCGRLRESLTAILKELDPGNVRSIQRIARQARDAVLAQPLPDDLHWEIAEHYDLLCAEAGGEPSLAVRSSATAEDLPGVSFAGQHSTFLNVRGIEELLVAVHHCYASLFTDRAIDYRIRNGFEHMSVALSVGIQQMIRSDVGVAGVIFTLDPESGFRNAVVVSGSYGLGETIVQGTVNPDEWTVFKPTLATGHEAIIERRLGTKESKLVFESNSGGTRLVSVDAPHSREFCLSDPEVLQLAKWSCAIEDHYSELADRPEPMDIEWAKDGLTGELYILQARPETGHSRVLASGEHEYRLVGTPPEALATGQAVGEMIGSGPVRIVRDPTGLSEVKAGDVLVAETTDPDWEPVMRRVAAIVTDQGGRTAHAAIVSREIGIPCIVGTGEATKVLHAGDTVTVCCAEGPKGSVYPGNVDFTISDVDFSTLSATKTKTDILLNVGDPANAFSLSMLPVAGVGLARMEFIVNTAIAIHPMALCRYPRLRDSAATAEIKSRIGDMRPDEYFVQRLSEGLAKICAAFYPRPVIVRTSDFKTNEYARLLD